jgi:FdhE protein
MVHAHGPASGVRYLHCSLCESEWRLARIQCSHCDGEKNVVYVGIEGSSEAVRAEACDDCHIYLKIFHRAKDQGVDPIADDLATLGLDLAMAEAGYARSGPNLLFVPGEESH